jgi:hypothetical protein
VSVSGGIAAFPDHGTTAQKFACRRCCALPGEDRRT